MQLYVVTVKFVLNQKSRQIGRFDKFWETFCLTIENRLLANRKMIIDFKVAFFRFI